MAWIRPNLVDIIWVMKEVTAMATARGNQQE
jgi:hypothetical protein